MRVRELLKTDDTEVYTIYWVKGVRHYSVIPYFGYEGFISVREDEVEITDDSITDRFIIHRHEGSADSLIHWAAYEGNLLDELIDHQSAAMAEFAWRLKNNYRKGERFPGSPPLDMLRRSSRLLVAAESTEEFQFCPKCFEGNIRANGYDEAIRCPSCGTLYNCLP